MKESLCMFSEQEDRKGSKCRACVIYRQTSVFVSPSFRRIRFSTFFVKILSQFSYIHLVFVQLKMVCAKLFHLPAWLGHSFPRIKRLHKAFHVFVTQSAFVSRWVSITLRVHPKHLVIIHCFLCLFIECDCQITHHEAKESSECQPFDKKARNTIEFKKDLGAKYKSDVHVANLARMYEKSVSTISSILVKKKKSRKLMLGKG